MKTLTAILIGLAVVTLAANAAVAWTITPEAIIDNQDGSGYSETGSWGTSGSGHIEYYNGSVSWDGASAGDADTATWAFTDLANGIYDVYASWYSVNDASSAVVYSGLDGGDLTVDQTINPSEVYLNDGTNNIEFDLLGQVTVTDGTATISVTSDVPYLYADAVAVVQVPL